MSLAYFIAQRIHFSRVRDAGQRVSPPAVRIAIAGIAIGLAVMILSVAIVIGFKQEIRDKAIGFGAHMQLQAFTANRTFETEPVALPDTLLDILRQVPDIRSVHPFATKPAILKTDEDFLAVTFKGILTEKEGGEFFRKYLKTGAVPAYEAWGENESMPSAGIVISRIIADKLHLDIGDEVAAYFVKMEPSDPFSYGNMPTSVRSRRLRIEGIYESHFNEYDRLFVAADLHLLQSVSGWPADVASGLEIELSDFSSLERAYSDTFDALASYADATGENYYLRTVEQINPQLFSWLALLDTNVWVILILIATVAAFTMISGLLIIILERANMIGILKASGYDNRGLRHVFMYIALFLTGKGLLWGNAAGLLLCFIQQQWHPLRLDPQNYYLEWVPIALSPLHLLLLNLGTVALTLLVLLAPSALVAHIRPTQAIQTE